MVCWGQTSAQWRRRLSGDRLERSEARSYPVVADQGAVRSTAVASAPDPLRWLTLQAERSEARSYPVVAYQPGRAQHGCGFST